MKKYSFWLALIASLSTVFNLAANLISGRVGFFGPFIAPMGVFFFPFIYILSDITSDVYGYRVSRWVAWWTALSNLLFIGLIMLVLNVIKPAPFVMDLENALRLCLSTTFRVCVASVVGAVLGGWTNDIIFQIFRHKDGLGKFIKRKLLSSIGGELVDTVTFITIAFIGTASWGIVMYIVQFVLKYTVEVITAPVAKTCVKWLRCVEGQGAFEDRNKFNIFGFEKS